MTCTTETSESMKAYFAKQRRMRTCAVCGKQISITGDGGYAYKLHGAWFHNACTKGR